MFQGRRRYVEQSCARWFILSALHQVLAPDELIAPYDVTLENTSTQQRRARSEHVLGALESRLGQLGEFEFEIHAGSAYRDFGLVDGLRSRGSRVTIPAEGLRQGEQLAFYSSPTPRAARPPAPNPDPTVSPRTGSYAAFGDYLSNQSENVVELPFSTIERIIGRSLPASALRHRAWWANSTSHPLASAWLSAGWRLEAVDQQGARARFRRGAA